MMFTKDYLETKKRAHRELQEIKLFLCRNMVALVLKSHGIVSGFVSI